MERTSLSNIELYYTEKKNVQAAYLIVEGDEAKHIQKVMRHGIGEIVYVTDGMGKLYKTEIEDSKRDQVRAKIVEVKTFENKYANITVCLPLLKSNDRFEFALEKCTELGITNFIVFNAERSIGKNIKLGRCKKILLAAMKQSLHTYMPIIDEIDSFNMLKRREGIKFVFEQNTKRSFIEYLSHPELRNIRNKIFLIFGPEGGLCDEEIHSLGEIEMVYLTKSRLRSESAIITSVSILITKLESIKDKYYNS